MFDCFLTILINVLCLIYRWLDTVKQRYQEIPQSDSNLSWAAYHASKESGQDNLPAITALLPLFPDDSKSVGMIRHSMDVIKKAVMEVNQGQIPVITVDQPLYTISKQISGLGHQRTGKIISLSSWEGCI